MTDSGMYEPESTRIVQQLRDDILDGVRPPGSRLVERDLAAELGVSRLPIRDALKVLVTEGLVTLRPRTWAVVREFSPTDITELNEVRSSIEVLAFRLAAERRTSEDLQRLRANVERELTAAHAGDAVQARRAAADFHALVTDIANNTLLSEIGGMLDSRMRWLLRQYDNLVEVALEHEALYTAIEASDVDAVLHLARQHVCKGQSVGEGAGEIVPAEA